MEWFAAIVVIGFIVAFAWWKDRRLEPNETPSLFQSKALLTENELEFLHRLELAIPELRFHAQVAMGALISPTAPRYQKGGDYYRLRGQFSQKIVDFVAQLRSDGRIVAVIELDDKTHDPAKDAQRDSMLRQAGYKVVRWHSKSKPDVETIRRELLDSSLS